MEYINIAEVERKLQLPIVKVDLGCGLNRHEREKNEYIYIDGDKADGIDIVCDWNNISLESGIVDEVHSSDTIEHVMPIDYDITFKEWNRILKIGGWLWGTTPNRTEIIRRAYEGLADEDWIQHNLYGHGLGLKHTHYTTFTKKKLTEVLEKYGFEVIIDPHDGWIHFTATKVRDI